MMLPERILPEEPGQKARSSLPPVTALKAGPWSGHAEGLRLRGLEALEPSCLPAVLAQAFPPLPREGVSFLLTDPGPQA